MTCDRAFIDRLAGLLSARGLTVPAIVALESMKPFTFVGSQALVFFDPVVKLFLEIKDYPRFIALLEDREKVEELILALEAREEERRGRRAHE